MVLGSGVDLAILIDGGGVFFWPLPTPSADGRFAEGGVLLVSLLLLMAHEDTKVRNYN